MIFDVYRAYSEEAFPLRPEFVESAVEGSLFVFSVVPEIECAFGAKVIGGAAVVRSSTGCYSTVVVAGVHKHFPNWDMNEVSDDAMRISREFFNQEYRRKAC